MLIDDRRRSLERAEDPDKHAIMPHDAMKWLEGEPPDFEDFVLDTHGAFVRLQFHVHFAGHSAIRDERRRSGTGKIAGARNQAAHPPLSLQNLFKVLRREGLSTFSGELIGGTLAGLAGSVVGVIPAMALALLGMIVGRLVGNWLDLRHNTLQT